MPIIVHNSYFNTCALRASYQLYDVAYNNIDYDLHVRYDEGSVVRA